MIMDSMSISSIDLDLMDKELGNMTITFLRGNSCLFHLIDDMIGRDTRNEVPLLYFTVFLSIIT